MVTTELIPLKKQDYRDKVLTIEEYYNFEEKSLHKHEYHAGKIIRMAGSLLNHNLLAQHFANLVQNFIKAQKLGYKVSNSDTKIRIDYFNKIVYPDAVVICVPPIYFENRKNTVSNPLLVLEVLSPSSKKFDMTTKFEMYRTIPSLSEYVLIHQEIQHLTVWSKQMDNSWIPKDFEGKNAIAVLESITGCEIDLDELYSVI